MSKKEKSAFTLAEGGHSPLLYGDEGVAEGYSCVETKGGRSPLLSGDEGTQGSPRLGSRRLLLYATKGAQGSPHLVKRGFTLAEVLITLGVIGVVAAMTMPTLVQNYRNHVVETRLQKVYSVMNQAIKQSEVVNGEKENWDFDDPQFYEKYLAPYLNVLKKETVEGTSYDYNCVYFNDGSLLVSKASNQKLEDGTTQAKTGANQDYYFYPYAKNFDKELVDSRATAGSVMFPFRFAPNHYPPEDKIAIIGTKHYKRGFEPYMYALADDAYLYSGYSLSCNKESSAPMFCTALIMMNGWKIPKDYPFKVR